ncbi:uncharacterized protein LOC113296333 [Papaver somniferum]|uniref:uncharacterized protein LOC113296333 n=1 Tax=Papaver somniferum TaxID=3469 RepID=UPI000E6FAA03|nr:uncharacterized protein LOC113296333 [Papaver somniferum]
MLRFEITARNSDEEPTDVSKLNAMKLAMSSLQETRLQHITFLKQKFRNSWLVEGASNTAFFHNNIRIRQGNNTISELVYENGVTVSEVDQLHDHVVQFYENKFNGDELPIEPQLFDYEHPSLSAVESSQMDDIPSPEEIKAIVFNLNVDGAPGPDGFSGCFYRHCWEIIGEDLINVVVYCWHLKIIPNGVNSSLITLLAKVRGANTLRNYRPIGLSNFFFKVFTKILATRLGGVLDNLVSEEQVAFMKGRNIHENISVASEMVNELHIKRKDGNIGLKLDITQAFDTVSWSFVLEVFRRYGFSEDWCLWILNILQSTRISILLNGSPEGYFKITRGLRQGDPLSPLVFVLIEDVLSRKLLRFSMKRRCPTWKYEECYQSGKPFGYLPTCFRPDCVSAKEQDYYGGGSLRRRNYLADFLGLSVATFPNRYLGVQIMPGTVRAIRNFIWTGDSSTRRDFVVAYDKICTPYSEGGLGLCRMAVMNKALLMKLWWKIRTSNKLVENNTKLLIGDGSSTSLYFDNWCTNVSIASLIDTQDLDRSVLVRDILINGEYVIPEVHLSRLIAAGIDLSNLPVLQGGEDIYIWMPDLKGWFSVQSARELIRARYPVFDGASLLWRQAVHPPLAAQNWKFLREACATQDKLCERFKINIANICYLCKNSEESLEHVLWSCCFSRRAWNWIGHIFGLVPNYNNIVSYKSAKGRSRMVKDLWLMANLVVKSELWAFK